MRKERRGKDRGGKTRERVKEREGKGKRGQWKARRFDPHKSDITPGSSSLDCGRPLLRFSVKDIEIRLLTPPTTTPQEIRINDTSHTSPHNTIKDNTKQHNTIQREIRINNTSHTSQQSKAQHTTTQHNTTQRNTTQQVIIVNDATYSAQHNTILSTTEALSRREIDDNKSAGIQVVPTQL